MRLFQSSITAKTLLNLKELCDDVKVNVLRSYLVDGPGTIDILNNARHCIDMLVLDSGTWSMNQGKHQFSIDVHTYAGFLKSNSHLFDEYFGFDPVHGDEGTEDSIANQIILERLGFRPIPIIQNINTEVEYYCERRDDYDIVAIGSTGQKKFSDIKNAVNTLYENGIKVHLFGIGSYKKLVDLPVWSSDCSSFAQWIKAGRLIYFDGKKEVTFSTARFNKSGKLNKDFIEISPHKDAYEEWLWEGLKLTLDKVIHKNEMKMVVNSYYF